MIGERGLSLMKPKAEEKLEALDFRPGRDVAKDNLLDPRYLNGGIRDPLSKRSGIDPPSEIIRRVFGGHQGSASKRV